MRGPDEVREKRANGEASQERILLAATEIAGERGYHGTTVSLVSERSGLPASSIYWHFANKDELLAAVIERSYERWAEAFDRPFEVQVGSTTEEVFQIAMARIGGTLVEFPDFLRLGLMLILDRRPDEPTARARFVAVRGETSDLVRTAYRQLFDDLDPDEIDSLVTVTMALSDGMFIAREIEDLDLPVAFDLIATTVLGTVDRMRERHSQ